jgi:MFS family permease
MRRSLTLSVFDGLLHAMMVGVCESYLGAFAVELGHRDAALALLVTVPLVCGALAQLLSAPLVRFVGSRRRFVALGACLQALTHLAFFAIARSGERRLAPLLAATVAYWVFAMVIAPAWNTWMAVLTERVDRARYFAFRSLAINLVLVTAFMGGGFVLERGRAGGDALDAFATLHLVALAARLGSAWMLARKHDPTPAPTPAAKEVGSRLARALREGSFRVPLFIAALMFGAQIAIPFFTPYMLRELHLDFVYFAWLTAASILAKALSFPLFRMASERGGHKLVLVTSSAAVALVPLLWARADGIGSLFLIQALSGVAWGGYEFASLQILLHQAPPALGVEYFSLASTSSGVAQVLGSLLGSALLTCGGLDYRGVFVASALGRGLALLLLVPTVAALPAIRSMPRLFLRVLSVRPGSGAVRAPIMAPRDDLVTPPEGRSGEVSAPEGARGERPDRQALRGEAP